MTTIDSIKGIIYVIKNKINQKIYVGQTLSHTYNEKNKCWEDYGVNMRLLKHLYKVQQKVDYPLYNDIKQYGIQNFEIRIENEIESEKIETLDKIELDTIKKYNSIENGYNLSENTSFLCENKKLILNYFQKNIERTDEYTKRNERRKQLTIPQKERYSFFQNKIILNCQLKPIRQGNEYKMVRVLIDVGDKDIYRFNFLYENILMSYNKALEFCKEIYKGEIFCDPVLSNIVDDNCYQYQSRLEECKNKKIVRINGKDYYDEKLKQSFYFLSIFF